MGYNKLDEYIDSDELETIMDDYGIDMGIFNSSQTSEATVSKTQVGKSMSDAPSNKSIKNAKKTGKGRTVTTKNAGNKLPDGKSTKSQKIGQLGRGGKSSLGGNPNPKGVTWGKFMPEAPSNKSIKNAQKYEGKAVFENFDAMVKFLAANYSKMAKDKKEKIHEALNHISPSKMTAKMRSTAITEAEHKAEIDTLTDIVENLKSKLTETRKKYATDMENTSGKLREMKKIHKIEINRIEESHTKYIDGIHKKVVEKVKNYDASIIKTNKKKFEKTCKVFEQEYDTLIAKHKKEIAQLKEKQQSDRIKSYIDDVIETSGIKIGSKTRALLENCTTRKEVDNELDKYRESLREGILHSNTLKSVKIGERKNPVDTAISERIKNVMSGLS